MYLGCVVRPTDQEMIAIRKRVCYSCPKRRGHVGHRARTRMQRG